MAKPWKILDKVETPDGLLELRQRGERDFLIVLNNLILMNSMANMSEVVLGEMACKGFKRRPAPKVLVSGLGMGCTLKAVLDSLPPAGRVVVCDLNPVVVNWCKGPLARLTANSVSDPRVSVAIVNVANRIKEIAKGPNEGKLDAIVLDLYTGPDADTHPFADPLYGSSAIENARRALKPNGVFAVWGENFDAGFQSRLRKAGFAANCERPGRGGLRHVVYLAKLKKQPKPNKSKRPSTGRAKRG